MTIFLTDIEALIYVGIIAISLYTVNRIISYLLYRSTRIPIGRKNKINFVLKLISIFVIIFFTIEGFPLFTEIPEEYTAIITGAISTALAFATSEIFSNFIAGILLWIVDPIDIGDLVKIKDHKGVVKSITLTKVVIETFDRIIVEISNSDVISSIVLNYTIKLKSRRKFFHFKRQIRSPQDNSNARLDIDEYSEEERKMEENEIKEFFNQFSENGQSVVYSFTFKMRFPYERFRIKIDKVTKLCSEYKEIFGYTPSFHVIDFHNEIVVKCRILTLNENKLLNYQAQFAEDIYKIILAQNDF